jgi:WD40 repeat protein
MRKVTLVIAISLAVVPRLVHAAEKPARPVLIVSTRTGNADIFLVDAASGDARNLTNHAGNDGFPGWSADGKRIVFASDRDGSTNIYVMDADGSNLQQLTHDKIAQKCGCVCPSLSPDGKWVAFARLKGEKHQVCKVPADPAMGTKVTLLAEDAFDPTWSPDGKRIAFASHHGKAGWRLAVMKADGSDRHELTDTDNPAGLTTPAWSPDGRWIAYTDRAPGATEIFLITAEGQHRHQLTFCSNMNCNPAWSADGEAITFMHMEVGGSGFLTIRADGTGLVPDNVAGTDRPVGPGFRLAFRPRPGAKAVAYGAEVVPTGAFEEAEESSVRVVSHTIEQEDLAFRILQRLPGHTGAIRFVGFAPEGKHLVTAGEDGAVVHWTWTEQGFRPEPPLVGPKGAVIAACWSPDGTNVATSYSDGTVKLWDVDHHSDWLTIDDLPGRVPAIAWSPDGKLLALSCEGRKVQVRRAATGKLVKSFDVPGKRKTEVVALAFTADNKTLLVGGGDPNEKRDSGFISAWDVKSGNKRWAVEKVSGGVLCMAVSPDGRTVAMGSRDGTVRLRETASGESRGMLEGHKEGIMKVAWSPDGDRVASASLDHTVRVWDADSCCQRAVLTGHLAPAFGVSFSRDGKVIASCGADRLVCVWHLEE